MSGLERTRAAARRGAAWLLPADRRDWVAAVWAEAHEVPPGLERLAWRVGGVWMLARGALMPRRLVRVALFAVTAAVAAWTAWPDSSVLHAAADQCRSGVLTCVSLSLPETVPTGCRAPRRAVRLGRARSSSWS